MFDLNNIYLITNEINKRQYIGKTIRDINIRFHEHCFDLDGQSSLKKDIFKFGWKNFKIEKLLNSAETEEEFNLQYNNYIEYYKPFYNTQYKINLNKYNKIIFIKENGLIFESRDQMVNKINLITNWSLKTISILLNQSLVNNIPFLGYTLEEKISNRIQSDNDEQEDWIKELKYIFPNMELYCLELNKKFKTSAEAAKYFIDNNLCDFNSCHIETIISNINNNLKNKKNNLNNYTFFKIPVTVKINRKKINQKKIFCKELNINFNNIDEIISYFIKNEIVGKILSKTLEKKINNVIEGFCSNYKGYSFTLN